VNEGRVFFERSFGLKRHKVDKKRHKVKERVVPFEDKKGTSKVKKEQVKQKRTKLSKIIKSQSLKSLSANFESAKVQKVQIFGIN